MESRARVQAALLLAVLAAAAEADHGGQGRARHRLSARMTDRMADIVHPEIIVDHLDVDALVQRIDIETLIGRIDIDALVRRIDIDALVGRIDMDALVTRIDIERLLAGVDLNALLDRVDVDAIVDRLDVRGLVIKAGIPEIVRESTGEITGSVIDVGRRQIAALDEVVGRIAYRLTGRDPRKRPDAPLLFEEHDDKGLDVDETGRGQITGHYAGPVSRLAAFALDMLLVFGVFTLCTAGVRLLADTFGWTWTPTAAKSFAGVALLWLWGYGYYALSLVAAGRTLGMGLVGLRVVDAEGSPLKARHALVRTLVLPVAVLPLCLGCIGIVTSPRRRALHDVAGHSAVVRDWGDRPAELPAPLTQWISQRADQ